MARIQIAISTPMCLADDCIAVWDVGTGNMLSTYRWNDHKSANFIPRHCIDRIGYDYLINSYQNSPLLNVWSLDGKNRLHSKIVLPGNVGALCVTPDSNYCLVAIDTRLYIWQLASGYLLAVLDGHYQSIRVVRVNSDQTHLVTGGDDGMIVIWNFVKVIVPDAQKSFSVVDGQCSRSEPERAITNSSTAILDIHMGLGRPTNVRFAVCAEQSPTVKLYELMSGVLLASVSFPQSVTSVIMDRMERALFAGSFTGEVYELLLCPMYKQQKTVDELIMINEKSEQSQKFEGHSMAVNAMAITIDGQALLTASQDKTIRMWHIRSHQCMRTVHCKGPVSNLIVCASMAGLFLFDSLESYNYSLNTRENHADLSLANHKVAKPSNNDHLRPQSIEQTLRALPNPPKPISATFERNIFQLRFNPIDLIGGVKPHVDHAEPDQLLDAFANGGCLWIRNNESGQLGPFESEIEINEQATTINEECMKQMSDENHKDENSQNDQLIGKLRQANHQLYEFAMEAIFEGCSK